MIIAIDGPAASGKGTLAKRLAAHYNLAFMDTGALYRAVAFHVMDDGLSIRDRRDVMDTARKLARNIQKEGAESILGNPTLREDKIGTEASKIAAMQEVREILLDTQRDFAKNPPKPFQGAVLDGRDIGTVIVPNADVKLFVTADVKIRAERRQKELQSRGIRVTYSTVLADMRARDDRDAHTLDAHTAPGYRTNVLDTTDLTADDAFQKAMAIVNKTV